MKKKGTRKERETKNNETARKKARKQQGERKETGRELKEKGRNE